jgi:pimeloyl-ACP methyl ester carboxylesterase
MIPVQRPTRRAARSLALALGCLAAVLVAPAAHARPRPQFAGKLAPCLVQGVPDSVLCGRFEVPEDRAKPNGRKISLNVVLVPATGDSVANDPVVFLAGGGVAPATRYAGFLSRAFARLRQHRDILLVDQRGTWGSHPLGCDGDTRAPALRDTARALAALRRCRDSLATTADLCMYSTANAMDDLDAVRGWLGYERLNLYGVSYGTKAAQVYIRQHPDRVRAAVLYGVVPLAGSMQLDLAASAQATFDRVCRDCAADSACHAMAPDLKRDLETVLTNLTRKPWQQAVMGKPGAPGTVEITDRAVRDLVQGMLGGSRPIERLPYLIHTAAAGARANPEDSGYGPIARALDDEGGPPPPPRGVFLCILCSEGMPPMDRDGIELATKDTFFGSFPVRWQAQQCAQWPHATLPDGFLEPVRSSVPVLAISGDLDPISPPRYGESVIRGFVNGRHIVVSNRSHNDVDPCITSLFESFLLAGTAAGLDTSCVALPRPLRFATGPAPAAGR